MKHAAVPLGMRIVATARFIDTDIGHEENRVNEMETQARAIGIAPSEKSQVQTMQTHTPPSRRTEVRHGALTPPKEVVPFPMGDMVHDRWEGQTAPSEQQHQYPSNPVTMSRSITESRSGLLIGDRIPGFNPHREGDNPTAFLSLAIMGRLPEIVPNTTVRRERRLMFRPIRPKIPKG